jgi:hypothetical protein
VWLANEPDFSPLNLWGFFSMNIAKSLGRVQLLAVGFALLSVVGCSGGNAKATGTLEGKVTYEGKPVSGAQVMLQSPETGAADTARLTDQGSYKIANPLVVGRYLVSIVPVQDLPPAGSGKPLPPPANPENIPVRYRTPDKSGLDVKLVKGTNTFDVKMTAK